MNKVVMYDAGGWFAEVYTDDNGGSGDGDNPKVGRWYGSRAECEAIDLGEVKLHPLKTQSDVDEFDLACERRWD